MKHKKKRESKKMKKISNFLKMIRIYKIIRNEHRKILKYKITSSQIE